MNYYISDIHFGNEALLIPPDGNEARKGTRPFSSVEEMNEKIIENINDCCTAEDTLYIIGDIAQFYNAEESISLLKHLVPKLVLIMGNHDKGVIAALKAKGLEVTFKSLFERVISGDSLLIRDGKYDLLFKPLSSNRMGWLLQGQISVLRACSFRRAGACAINAVRSNGDKCWR